MSNQGQKAPGPADRPDAKKAPQSNENATSPSSEFGDVSLPFLIAWGMGGALLMLVTPCVFPMIPVTVTFFVKQSEKKGHNALLTELVYSGTIILVLMVAVLGLGSVIITWAN